MTSAFMQSACKMKQRVSHEIRSLSTNVPTIRCPDTGSCLQHGQSNASSEAVATSEFLTWFLKRGTRRLRDSPQPHQTQQALPSAEMQKKCKHWNRFLHDAQRLRLRRAGFQGITDPRHGQPECPFTASQDGVVAFCKPDLAIPCCLRVNCNVNIVQCMQHVGMLSTATQHTQENVKTRRGVSH
jgi:hypothetical protein